MSKEKTSENSQKIFDFMTKAGTLKVNSYSSIENDEHMNHILTKIRTNLADSNKNDIVIQVSDEHNDLNIPSQDSSIIWNKEIEEEIMNIAQCCKDEAYNAKSQGDTFLKYSKYLQLSLIILGSTSVYISASPIESNIKEPINVVLGAFTTIISSVYTMFSFSKKGLVYKEVGQSLDNLARILRCEILKPIDTRQSVNELILFSQMSRDKYLKKLDN